MATDGVPRALFTPASRASAATRSKPTMRGQADGGVVQRPLQRVARRYLVVILALDSCAACTPGRAHVVGGLLIAQHGHRRKQLVWPGSMVPSTAVLKGRRIDKRLEDRAGGPLAPPHGSTASCRSCARPPAPAPGRCADSAPPAPPADRCTACPASCRCACSLSTCSSTTWMVESTARVASRCRSGSSEV